jgi:hypothetical protein
MTLISLIMDVYLQSSMCVWHGICDKIRLLSTLHHTMLHGSGASYLEVNTT